MTLSFVCPNCRKLVDPMTPNAVMASATKLWQHRDCGAEVNAKSPAPSNAPPTVERRKRPRRSSA